MKKQLLQFSFLAVATLCFAQLCHAQVLVKKGSDFYHGNNIYKFDGLIPLFEGNDIYLDFYNNALSRKKAATRAFRVAGITGLISGIGIVGAWNSSDLATSILLILGGVTSGAVAIVALVIGTAHSGDYRSRTQSLLDVYNQDNGTFPKKTGDSSYLQLGATPNGIGIVYSF